MSQALTCRLEHSINSIFLTTNLNKDDDLKGIGSLSAGREKNGKALGMSDGMLQNTSTHTVLSFINNGKLFSVVVFVRVFQSNATNPKDLQQKKKKL